jgi:transcriptional regulator with XRE-family HTH domain
MIVKDEAIAAAFGTRLRQLRAAAGLSQSQLAGRTDPPMQVQAIARYEAGDRAPTLTVLYRLAAALAVEPSDLLPASGKRRRRK